MSRILATVVTVIIVALGAGYGWLWLSAQRTIPLSVSPSDRAAAVAHSDRIVELGSEPGKWPVRLFIPSSALQDIAGTTAGTTYRVPFGGTGPGGPDGYLVATVRKLEFLPTDFLLRARVEMDVTYAAGSTSPWWAGATLRFTGKADMLPVSGGQSGSKMLGLRLVPTGFSPAIHWGPLNVAATEMLSHIVASRLLERLGQDLVIPIPALSVPIDIRSGMSSTHEGSFPAGGTYTLTAHLDGGSLRGEISTDRLLIVSSGIWLLGGLPDAGPASPVSQRAREANPRDAEQRVLTIRKRLAPFERTSGHAEAHIPIAPILSMIQPDAPGPPAPAGYGIRAAITEATGTLFKTSLADNRVTGDISLTVLPASHDFASGTLSFAPLGLRWQKSRGLTGELDATIHARAKLRAYLTGARFRQAIATKMAVQGTTTTTIPFTLGLKLMRGPEGSAVMLVPDVPCTRVAVDLHHDKGAPPVFSTPWYSLQSAGVRLERNIGGGAAASFPILDSKPHYIPFPVAPFAEGVTWPSDGVAVTMAPKALVLGEDGIDVTVSLHARSATTGEQASFAAERAGLHASLREGLPAKPCLPDQRFKLLL